MKEHPPPESARKPDRLEARASFVAAAGRIIALVTLTALIFGTVWIEREKRAASTPKPPRAVRALAGTK
jgi:hypothetical protein